MEVILLEKIRNLGGIGARVRVKAGYGRNYLIPQQKAVSATEDNLKLFESRRAELEKKAAEDAAAARERAAQFEKLAITISARSSEEGKLYGSVGAREIADAIKRAGGVVEKREIELPTGPIRSVGEYEVGLQIHSDVTIKIKVLVVAEEGN